MNSPTELSSAQLVPAARANRSASPSPTAHGASPIAVATRYIVEYTTPVFLRIVAYAIASYFHDTRAKRAARTNSTCGRPFPPVDIHALSSSACVSASGSRTGQRPCPTGSYQYIPAATPAPAPTTA